MNALFIGLNKPVVVLLDTGEKVTGILVNIDKQTNVYLVNAEVVYSDRVEKYDRLIIRGSHIVFIAYKF